MTGLAGEQPALDTSRRLLGVPRWGREGSSRVRAEPVADPALVRRLDVGQVAYIYRGGVTFVQVKRLLAAPAALATPPRAGPVARAGPTAAAVPAARAVPAAQTGPAAGAVQTAGAVPAAGPDDAAEVAALLDEAFGAEPG